MARVLAPLPTEELYFVGHRTIDIMKPLEGDEDHHHPSNYTSTPQMGVPFR